MKKKIEKLQAEIMQITKKLHKISMDAESKYYPNSNLCNSVRYLDDAASELEQVLKNITYDA